MTRNLPMLALLLAVSGCPGKLDSAKLEKEIEKTIEKETGASVESVSCPKGRPLEEGDKFECDVEFDGGGDAEVSVKQTNNKGDVKYKLEGQIIVPKTLEGVIEEGLGQKGISGVDVDCGEKVRKAKKNDTFECEATDDQKNTRTVAITVKDEEGNINWEVK